VRIRRAEDADLPAINDLTRRSSAYEGEYHAMVEGIEVTPEQLRRDHCHVAVSGDRLLGYYSLVAEPPDLDLMFVDDAARGRGVGRLLFEHMLATARGLGITAVRIVSHPPAAAFYERMGAVRVGTKPAAGRVTWDRPVLRVDTGLRGRPGDQPPAGRDR
jgi:GNAT superfamily N-acetyltransferase